MAKPSKKHPWKNRNSYKESTEYRKGREMYGPKRTNQIDSFTDFVSRHESVKVKTRKKKFSELFDDVIEFDVYSDSPDLDESEISAYAITPDLGEDLIEQVNSGYNILPGVY